MASWIQGKKSSSFMYHEEQVGESTAIRSCTSFKDLASNK